MALEMRQAILADVTGNATGFAYAIVKDGKLAYHGGGGFARTGPDGSAAMTSSHRVNVMGVTKPITAVATHQLLSKLGLSVDSAVAPWLPPLFALGDGFGGVKREVQTCVMKFPNDIQATLVINSTNLSGSSQCGVLLNAYQDATA